MDRINLLLAALAPGAANPAEGPSDAVERARADLKGEVERHFGGRVEAKTALERYADKPDVERERLKDMLESTEVVEDFAVVAAAQNGSGWPILTAPLLASTPCRPNHSV